MSELSGSFDGGERQLTAAADVFALGCVLYECLAGEPPFAAEHVAAVLVRVLFEDPVPLSVRRPGLPAGLLMLLEDMLIKDPARRIPDAAALVARLADLGAMPDPPSLPTLAAPAQAPATFAQHEQALFSLVLAIEPTADESVAATLPAAEAPVKLALRAALLSGVQALGGRLEYLASGALVVAVPSMASAQDQAAMAARVALLLREDGRTPRSL